MDRSPREPVAAVSLGSGPSWTLDRHIAMRIDFVVTQVAQTHRGHDEADVARVLADRLRSLGVPSVYRQVQQYAQAIARLPASPPPPKAA
jgi:hypothetical protein